MIKRSSFFLSLFFLFNLLVHANRIPKDETSFDQEFSFFGTKKIENHFMTLKVAHYFQDKQNDRNIIELGYRYGFDNWRFGGSISTERGLRHNEDWVLESGRWQWRDTSSRSEEIVRGFVQNKFFLWKKGILKNRVTLQHNFFNDQDTLILTSGIIWFGRGSHTFLHQFEVFVPLNFNRSFVSEIWHYTGYMYKLTKSFSLGPRLTLGHMRWNESLNFKHRTGDSFNNDLFIMRLGLGAFYHF